MTGQEFGEELGAVYAGAVAQGYRTDVMDSDKLHRLGMRAVEAWIALHQDRPEPAGSPIKDRLADLMRDAGFCTTCGTPNRACTSGNPCCEGCSHPQPKPAEVEA